MLEKLEEFEKKYEELTDQLSDPQLLADQQRYAKAAKQHRDLEEIVAKYREFKALEQGIKDTRELLDAEDDPEMLGMARAELIDLEARRDHVEEDLKLLLVPKDPTTKRTLYWKSVPGPEGTRPRCLPRR